MSTYFDLSINFGIPFALIVLALITGTMLEKGHYKSIHRREKELAHIPVLSCKQFPESKPIETVEFVSGSVVISIDYFKRFIAGLRMLFGGEVRSYISLVDRGRREATLRMKETCRDADLVVNFRIKTSSISKGRKRKIGSVEMFAYGTAIRYAKSG